MHKVECISIRFHKNTFNAKQDSYLVLQKGSKQPCAPGFKTESEIETAAGLHLNPYFFMIDLHIYWPLLPLGICTSLPDTKGCGRVTWSALLIWAKVITAFAFTIITYGFSMTGWIANWKACIVRFQMFPVDFSKLRHYLKLAKFEVLQFPNIDHFGQVIYRLVSVNGSDLVLISCCP